MRASDRHRLFQEKNDPNRFDVVRREQLEIEFRARLDQLLTPRSSLGLSGPIQNNRPSIPIPQPNLLKSQNKG